MNRARHAFLSVCLGAARRAAVASQRGVAPLALFVVPGHQQQVRRACQVSDAPRRGLPPPLYEVKKRCGKPLPHPGRKPILFASSIRLTYDAELVPRRQPFEGCRRLVLSGPKGSVAVYVPTYMRLWLEEPEEDITVGETAAQKAAREDPNNLGDPTALGPDTGLLWMRATDIEDESQLAGWAALHNSVTQAITGVVVGFDVPVRINGVGYRVALNQPSNSTGRPVLTCKLGYPNTFDHPVPEGITIKVFNPTTFTVQGPDRAKLLEFAMAVRAHRKPEPYKLKGVFVDGETIKKKEGKKGKRA